MTLSTHKHPVDTSTVTATIVFTGAAVADETIVITDAAGSSKTFTAKGSTTADDSEFIRTDKDAAATALKLCIDNAAGHGVDGTTPASITVADDGSGTLTLTLIVDGTYRFKNKASIVEGLSNCTVTQFGSTSGVEDKDGGVILNAGTPDSNQTHMNSPTTAKSPIQIVAGRKVTGSQLVLNAAAHAGTGATSKHQPGTAKANSSGTFGYDSSKSVAKRAINFASAPDSGLIIKQGVVNKVSGTALNPILSGSYKEFKGTGSIHSPNGAFRYQQLGTWATQIFDAFGGGLLQSDGKAKSGITGWENDGSNDASLAADHAAFGHVSSARAVGASEMTLLFNFVTPLSNNVDYSTITG